MAKLTKERLTEIVEQNSGLVWSVVKRFYGQGEPDDMFQAGVIGLMHAAEKYDPELGYTFSTYATPWIEREVRVSIKDDGVYMPYYISGKKNVIRSAIAKLKENDEAITPEAIAELVGLPVDRVKDILPHMFGQSSLDAQVGEDDSNLSDFIADERTDFESDYLHLETMKSVRIAVNRIPKTIPKSSYIYECYSNLPPKNSENYYAAVCEYLKVWEDWIRYQEVDTGMRDILNSYYFCGDNLEQISKVMGVSKQCIQQKRNKGFERLRMDPLMLLAATEL